MSTAIQWTDETWNPLAAFDRETGERGWFCTKVSPGCTNCYAERMNKRLGTGHAYAVPNLEKVEFRLVNLDRPLKWQASGKHVRVFVNSMTDLFHEEVPDGMLDRMFETMIRARDLTFQILTKRPERMAEYMTVTGRSMTRWPPRNIWLGTSVEDQERAEERIPHLLDTPAAVRFLSCEPLLGPVDLRRWIMPWRCLPCGWRGWPEQTDQTEPGSDEDCACPQCGAQTTWAEARWYPDEGLPLDWIIVGGESGPNARPMELGWAESLIRQGRAAGSAVFVKQLGSQPVSRTESAPGGGPWRTTDGGPWVGRLDDPKGGDIEEFPPALQVREFPDEMGVPA